MTNIDIHSLNKELNSHKGYVHIQLEGHILNEKEVLSLAQKIGVLVPPSPNKPLVENMISDVPDSRLTPHSKELFEERVVPFHTDKSYCISPPEAVMFHYVDLSCKGGLPLLANCHKVLSSLNDQDLENLAQPIDFLSPHNEEACVRESCISLKGSSYIFRYRFDLMDFSMVKNPETYRLSLEKFWKTIELNSFTPEVKSGDILIFNNFFMTHARSFIEDSSCIYRHMRRVLIQSLNT